jgi:hypothetical protein
VGGTCGTHGRGEENVQGFGLESQKERDNLEDQGVDGGMGSEWWQALLNTVMNFEFWRPPAEDDNFLMAIKICPTTFFGGEVSPPARGEASM